MTAKELKLDYFKFYDVENRAADGDILLRGQFDRRPQKIKVVFHPVDYVIFKDQRDGQPSGLMLLDRDDKSGQELRVQRSIERAIEKGRYSWQTLRVTGDGTVNSE